MYVCVVGQLIKVEYNAIRICSIRWVVNLSRRYTLLYVWGKYFYDWYFVTLTCDFTATEALAFYYVSWNNLL